MLRLRSAWDQLLAHHPDRVLLGHDWFAQCWKAFPENRRAEILTFHQAGRMCGILPFRRQRQRGIWQLAFLDDRHSPRLDLIVGPEDMPAMLAAAGEHLRDRRDWDIADLARVRMGTAEQILRIWLQLGLDVRIRGGMRQRYLPLDRPWPEIESTLKPSLRKNLRRRESHLQQQGRLEVRVHTDAAGLGRLMDCCILVEASGWKGEEGTAIGCQPQLERFYRQLAFRMARQHRLRIYGLWLQEELLAFQFCVVEGGRLSSLKVGYAASHAPWSPGQMLQWHVLRLAAEEGLCRFDFLGEDQPAQAGWSAFTEPLLNLRVYNRTLRGVILARRSQIWRWWMTTRGSAGTPAQPNPV